MKTPQQKNKTLACSYIPSTFLLSGDMTTHEELISLLPLSISLNASERVSAGESLVKLEREPGHCIRLLVCVLWYTRYTSNDFVANCRQLSAPKDTPDCYGML